MSCVHTPASRLTGLALVLLGLSGCSVDSALAPPAGVPGAPSPALALSAPDTGRTAPYSSVSQAAPSFPQNGMTEIAVADGRTPLSGDLPPVRDVLSYPSGNTGETGGLSPLLPEGQTSAPIVDGIGTDNPQLAATGGGFDDLGPDAAGMAPVVMPETQAPRQEAAEPQRMAGLFPRLNPFGRKDLTPGLPAAERECRARLRRLGVRFSDLPRIDTGPGCVIEHPVELTALSGGITIKPAAKLNCQITEAFALWVKKELAPAARMRYLSGIKSINQLSAFSCRTMNSKRGAPMSEHARGNAIDVGKITLDSGKAIAVSEKGLFAFREKGLLNSVRTDSCKYFTTVLGPGSDVHHKDHFHFDLRARKAGYRHCD